MKIALIFTVCFLVSSCSSLQKMPHPDGGNPEHWLTKVKSELPIGSPKEKALSWLRVNNFKLPLEHTGTLYAGELTSLHLSSVIESTKGGWACSWFKTKLVVILSKSKGVIGYDLKGEGQCL